MKKVFRTLTVTLYAALLVLSCSGCYSSSDLDSIRQEGYNEGYDVGYSEGYDTGCEDGIQKVKDNPADYFFIEEESAEEEIETARKAGYEKGLSEAEDTLFAQLGLINPYTNTVIENRHDYNEYLEQYNADMEAALGEDSVSQNTESSGNNSAYAKSEQSEMVWIPTNGGTKYHRTSGCSGMKDPEQVTLEEAEDMGYEPCGRCY